MFSDVRKTLDHIIDLGVPGNDFIVYHNGKCIFRETRGYSDHERTKKMCGDEMVNLYSSSKLITCTSAMKLYEMGKFSLEDPLYLYMPEFREMSIMADGGAVKAKNYIRVKDLFTMGAGFDYNMSSPEIQKAKAETNGKCPTRKVMEYIAERPLCFEPGTKWQYSICHDVLAAFVEVVSGVRFGEFVKKHVFDVAGMEHSTYSFPDEKLPSLMAQYMYKGDEKSYEYIGPKIFNFKIGDEYESGGAGCISRTDDYIKFLEALRTGIILKPETLALMTKNHLTEEQYKTFAASQPRLNGYGYGLGCWCGIGNEGCEDFGWTGAAGTMHSINPKHNLSMFYLQHVIAGPNREIWPTLRRHVRMAIEKL